VQGPETSQARANVLPVEFMVFGIPASLQGRKRRVGSWKAAVSAAAASAWPVGQPPTVTPVRLQVVYYHLNAPLDVDNMIKPIQDAMIGIIYDDDRQVTDVQAARRDLNGPFRVRGMSPRLAQGFVNGGTFVHITVSEPPDHQELLT
jgi:crossover junction endodeoxyribonuclease RusA